MIFRFTLFGREIFAFDLQWPDFGGPVDEGESSEPEERIRLGVNAELADDEQDFESCESMPYGFGPPTTN